MLQQQQALCIFVFRILCVCNTNERIRVHELEKEQEGYTGGFKSKTGRKLYNYIVILKKILFLLRMLLSHSALSCFAYPLLWKNITKSNLKGEKAFIWLKGSSSSLKEAMVGTQSKEGSLEPRFHERMLLTDLVFIACSPCFLMKLRTTCPVVALLV